MRLIVLLLFVTSTTVAQNVQKEIDAQVWTPFIKYFVDGDTDAFMALHSKDLVRSALETKLVLNWEQTRTVTATRNRRLKEEKTRLETELRFTERINNDNQAIDVGIYRTSYFTIDGKSRSSYGKFYVVHRKENGAWKILVDADSKEGDTITEQTFLAANPMN